MQQHTSSIGLQTASQSPQMLPTVSGYSQTNVRSVAVWAGRTQCSNHHKQNAAHSRRYLRGQLRGKCDIFTFQIKANDSKCSLMHFAIFQLLLVASCRALRRQAHSCEALIFESTCPQSVFSLPLYKLFYSLAVIKSSKSHVGVLLRTQVTSVLSY